MKAPRIRMSTRRLVLAATILAATGCSGGGASADAPVAPVVPAVPAPTISSFTVTPSTIANGQSATLTWTATGASTMSVDQGVGTVTGTSASITPRANTSYTLTATNSAGKAVTATAAVTVIGAPFPTITWTSGSTVKLEQVIGDKDWGAAARGITLPTASQTSTRYNVYATGFGYSFEDNGKMVLMFGDTRSKDETALNFHAADPIGWSMTTDGESGLLLNFFSPGNALPLFIQPPGVKMGADDICNSGIALPDGVYLVCNVGADITQPNPHLNSFSVLVRFDETTNTFIGGRTISHSQGGHFVFTAVHASGSDVYMYGMGQYRASDIYLSKTPSTGFWAGTGTQYFTGLVNGQPTWSSAESDAVPVIQDNPINGPAWPNDNPTVGNLSVGYSSDLGVWLTTFDGGRQTEATKGDYFSYAKNPWGPWAKPQLIFNVVRDGAWGVYIHNPSAVPDDGLDGPIIGDLQHDAVTTAGGAFAPQLIERFTRVSGNTLKIYFLISTWNPYTVVKMRSQFTIIP